MERRPAARPDQPLAAMPENTRELLRVMAQINSRAMDAQHPAAISGWWLLRDFIEQGFVDPDSPMWQWPDPENLGLTAAHNAVMSDLIPPIFTGWAVSNGWGIPLCHWAIVRDCFPYDLEPDLLGRVWDIQNTRTGETTKEVMARHLVSVAKRAVRK